MIKAGLASCFCKILHLLYNFDFNTINVDNEKLNLFVSSFGQLLSRILRSFTGSFTFVIIIDRFIMVFLYLAIYCKTSNLNLLKQRRIWSLEMI